VLDKHTTGDGLISALQVLQACARSGKSLAQLLEGVTLFPQTLINVRLQPGQDWKNNKALASETKRLEAELEWWPCADPRERHRARGARDGRGAREPSIACQFPRPP
jgi:phosphomannomutase